VRFAFDESDLGDGKASTRVRMMQPHGGGVEGWHFPLRKGTEVLFTFLGGDPDRPVIAGVVPNAHTPSPVTKANHTTNVVQTGGRNRFELEDKAGAQRITLSTPHTNTMIRMGAPNADHNMIIRTDGATLLDAGQDWDVTVGAKLTEDVKGSVTETYHTSQTTTIDGPRLQTVTAGGMIQDITGGWLQSVAGGGKQVIKGGYEQDVTGDAITNVSADAAYTVSGSETHIVAGSETHVVAGAVSQNFGPTNGIFASVNWLIPGGAKIVTPKWDVLGPVTEWHSPFKGEFVAVDLHVGAIAMEYVSGAKLEACGVHAETLGCHVENTGIHKESKGIKIGHGGTKTEAQALAVLTCGFLKLG
jgi:type VI secretion system secreted protein VgrG